MYNRTTGEAGNRSSGPSLEREGDRFSSASARTESVRKIADPLHRQTDVIQQPMAVSGRARYENVPQDSGIDNTLAGKAE